MKLLSNEEMRDLDKTAIEEMKIPGIALMENAGAKLADEAKKILNNNIKQSRKKVLILSGKGNNGGDGFVAARHLYNYGIEVKSVLIGNKNSVKGDAKTNLEILLNMGLDIIEIEDEYQLEEIFNQDKVYNLIIDAIFGTGIKGNIKGVAKKIIERINETNMPVLSADIPSGVNGSTGDISNPTIKADRTISFGFAKRGLHVYPGRDFCGDIVISDIGIPVELLKRNTINCELITKKVVDRSIITKERKCDVHKGNYGKTLIIAGSKGLTGAAVLAAKGALKSGGGLITLGVPKGVNNIIESLVIEAMTLPLPETEENFLRKNALEVIINKQDSFDCISIGPGIRVSEDTKAILKGLIKRIKKPLVIDADGLNCISDQIEILKEKKSEIIITPHPGEMARLTGKSSEYIQKNRIETAFYLATEYKIYVILKGAGTVICSPKGEIFINETGNPGMASGGTGDVLTGIITSFIGQGISIKDSCIAAVYFHGMAGDIALESKGVLSLTASDLVESLPIALKKY